MATRVERVWPDSTVAILGCGPSLSVEDVSYVRGKVKVIAINAAVQFAPWADAIYICDQRYWAYLKGAPDFTGLKYSVEGNAAKWPDVQVLKNTGHNGLELDPTGLRTGKNSGYQAINLAVHLGASRILLLGYDMKAVNGQEHFASARYPNRTNSPYVLFLRHFETLVEPLKKIGVEVINCTPRSSLKVWPRVPLREALPDLDAVTVPMMAEAAL